MSCLGVVALRNGTLGLFRLRNARNLSTKVVLRNAPAQKLLCRIVRAESTTSECETTCTRSRNWLWHKIWDQLRYFQQWPQVQNKIMLDSYQIEVATRKHAAEIEQFMLAEFGVNEPVINSKGMERDDIEDYFYDLSREGYSNEKYSTVVYDKKRLIAICLCGVYNLGEGTVLPEIDLDHHDFADDISNGPYKQHNANQLVTFVNTLEHKQRQLLGNNAKVFTIHVICVHRKYRGQGIAKELTRRAIELARSEGCDWVTAAVTAFSSQELLRSMRFETLYEVPYEAFRENGEQVFHDLHDFCESGKFMAFPITK